MATFGTRLLYKYSPPEIRKSKTNNKIIFFNKQILAFITTVSMFNVAGRRQVEHYQNPASFEERGFVTIRS